MTWLPSVAIACCLLMGCQTFLQSDEESDDIGSDLIIRSDVPLWMEDGTEAVAPRSFHTEQTFGCVSGVAMGDWKQTFNEQNDYQPEPVWWLLEMGGVFHCGGVFVIGSKQGDADILAREGGYTVDLGPDEATGLRLYLWEVGLRTGSTYTFLAAPADGEGDSFSVLAPDCAHGQIRRADPSFFSIFRTEYCAVPTQEAMRATARDAARRPPIGRMEFVGAREDEGN